MSGLGTRRFLLTAGIALPVFLAARPLAAAPEVDFRRIQKGVWVWRVSLDVIDRLLAFAADIGIRRVLLSLGTAVRQEILSGSSEWTRKLREFRARGITLGALTGDPEWPRRGERIPRSLQELIHVQARLGVFDLLHLDVEPHSLPEWRNGGSMRIELMQGMTTFFETVRTSTGGWRLEAALHPQYSRLKLSKGEPLMAALVRNIDEVSLMAYRGDAGKLLRLALPSIRIFEREGRPWRLGVLVHADKEPGVSFWGASREALVDQMIDLDRQARAHGAGALYRGLMFEDLDGLRAMLLRSE